MAASLASSACPCSSTLPRERAVICLDFVWREIADHTTRVPIGKDCRGNVLGHDRANADHSVVSDTDTGQNHAVQANAHIVLKHRPKEVFLHATDGHAVVREHRVSTDKNSLANACGLGKLSVLPNVDILSNAGVAVATGMR